MKDSDPVRDLLDFLKESNIPFTFDSYRNITKGCSENCRGWFKDTEKANPHGKIYCRNHQAAIERGKYPRYDSEI
jgi:hypothetical protein